MRIQFYKIYEVMYFNCPTKGNCVVQKRILIPHSEYLKTKNLGEKEQKAQLKKLSKGMEWFTEKSPIYYAIESGIYDCNNKKVRCLVKIFQKQ